MGDWLEMYVKVMQLDYRASTECTQRHLPSDGEWEVHLRAQRRAAHAASEAPGAGDRHVGLSAVSRRSPASKASPAPPCTPASSKAARRGRESTRWWSARAPPAHDICQDLHEQGAAEVTMVQRAPTIVVRSESLMELAWGPLYSEQAVARGISTRDRRPDGRLGALQGPARASETDLCRNQEARSRAICRTGKSGVPVHLRRGRLGHPRALPAPRRGLLHRDRRLADDHRRPDQAEGRRQRRAGRREVGEAERRQRAARGPAGVRHRLRLDEPVGARADQRRKWPTRSARCGAWAPTPRPTRGRGSASCATCGSRPRRRTSGSTAAT